MSIKQDLKSAIDQNLTIDILYKQENQMRKIHPYHYGIYGKEDHLHAYQISGPSESGDHQNWKNFALSKIAKVGITTENFSPPDREYNPSAPHYRVEHQIKYDGMKKGFKP